MNYPENPVLTRIRRGGVIESVHRGAWVLVSSSGEILAGVGDPNQLVFPRSASKSLQAIPLVESGASDRFGFDDKELAASIASHEGETQHLKVIEAMLNAAGLTTDDLRCGPQAPRVGDLNRPGTRLLNNCSGKHAGFLATSVHIGAATDSYLDPEGAVQQAVAEAVRDLAQTDEITTAIDGCGAPTFRMPLVSLATAIATVVNPERLSGPRAAACRRLVQAAAAYPELVGGSKNRFDSDLMRVTKGRLFAKVGAEAVFVIGDARTGTGLAIKIDDGSLRGLHFYLTNLMVELDMITALEHDALTPWSESTLRNWDDQIVGEQETTRHVTNS